MLHVQALVALLKSGWQGSVTPSGLTECEACMDIGLPVLLRTLDDYTTDRRGDVGSQCATTTIHMLMALVLDVMAIIAICFQGSRGWNGCFASVVPAIDAEAIAQ